MGKEMGMSPMEKFVDWWKKERGEPGEKRYVTLAKSLLLALLPVLCCLVYCAAHGRGLGEVYLPSSEWNDELFYYKQVEGIVNYGYPLGYFGFNESHALKLSFAAWSPVLVFPWVIWGMIFGWNLMSPIICNIVLMTLCCFLFVWLVRPTWKQLGILTLLFCLYTLFVRYMLSVMPEVICFSMLIIFYGLAINYLRRESAAKLALLLLLSGVMTLMRPYLLLFMLLPIYLWIRRNGWKGALGSLAVLTAVVGLYAWIKHYLGAEYFAPLFFTDWISAFFERGILGGIRYTGGKLLAMGKDFYAYTKQGILGGWPAGAFFAGYLVCMFLLIGQSLKDLLLLRRLEKKGIMAGAQAGEIQEEIAERARKRSQAVRRQLVIEVHLAFSFIAMLFALLLMYKLTEGSKHLLTFMAVTVFVVAVMETEYLKKAALLGIAFAYLYIYKGVEPYDYQTPFLQEERQASVEEWRGVWKESLALDRENVPSFENVVIWVFNDKVGNVSVNTSWQLLYALPEGFGINCCMPEYILQNFNSLNSRYLVCPSGGEIDARCRETGFRQIYTDDETVMYETR